MRWKHNKFIRRNGDIKIVKKFAFFPTKLKDGYTVWLEKYYVTYKWRVYNSRILKDEWENVDTYTVETYEKKCENSLSHL